jgi:hypothetical protein
MKRRIHRLPHEKPVFKCRFPGCENRPYNRTQDRGRHELIAHGMRHGAAPEIQPAMPAPVRIDPAPVDTKVTAERQEDAKDAARDITAARIQTQIDHLEARLKPLYDALAVVLTLD